MPARGDEPPAGDALVAAQFVLIAITAAVALGVAGWPDLRPLWRFVPGVALCVAGVAGFAATAAALGRGLTPRPRPREDARLVTSGPFRLVRHPMYGALLVLLAGVALLTTFWSLVPAAALAAVLERKTRLEERWLEARFPEYDTYRRRTPRRLLPLVY